MSNFFQSRYYSSKDYIKYAASKHWLQILLAFIIMGLIFRYIGNSQLPTNSPKPEGLDWWTKCLDPLIGLGTFLIALAVWFLEVNRERKNDMPNKLTVFFKYGTRTAMTCEKAYLASEGDIRAWGQQIGKQMAENIFLDFLPYIEQPPAETEFDESGKPFLHYQVTFFLNKLPQNQRHPTKEQQVFEERIKMESLTWRPIKGDVKKVEEIWA